MKISDFELFKSLLYERSGLVITPDKSYLLDSRLTPIAKKWGYPTLESMTLQLRALPDEKLIKDIVEAMTTNETSFFRDTKPFQIFQDTILPVMLEKTKSPQNNPHLVRRLFQRTRTILVGHDPQGKRGSTQRMEI